MVHKNKKQTQFHEKNRSCLVSKFVKLSDEIIISYLEYFVVAVMLDKPNSSEKLK